MGTRFFFVFFVLLLLYFSQEEKEKQDVSTLHLRKMMIPPIILVSADGLADFPLVLVKELDFCEKMHAYMNTVMGKGKKDGDEHHLHHHHPCSPPSIP